MTKIESTERLIPNSAEQIYTFLTNFNNFEHLMPSKVSDWTSTEHSCYFSISGIASLGMKIVEKQASHFIKMVDDGKVPFTFDFIINIKPRTEDSAFVKLNFNANLNPLLRMVAVKPLEEFLEQLLDHLENQKL